MDLVFACLEEIDRLIDGNAINPSEKAGVALKAGKGFVGLDEGFLSEIIGVLVVGRHVINCGVNPFLVALDEFVVRGDVARLSALDQNAVHYHRGSRSILADFCSNGLHHKHAAFVWPCQARTGY